VNSSTGDFRSSYSIEELKDSAKLMRGYNLVALNAAGSGHAGGTLSIMDITAALYLRVANHDPANPSWPDRDASSGPLDTKRPVSISASPSPVFVRSTTPCSSANSAHPIKATRTG
jgi:Transketolase, thiamine diphosphate binding domain